MNDKNLLPGIKLNPLVTVLMPVYNGGADLTFAIKSILNQTYKDFEFLIINDCSTDDSLETIRSFNDPRIVVHSNKVNVGQTKSLNIGLKLAKGKYIVINDADDLSLPRRIEAQLNFIMKNPEYVVVGTSSFIMDLEGCIKRTFMKPTDSREILLSVLSDTPVIHGSVIMDKDVILENGGYDEEFRICQDYELWSSFIRKGYKLANIPDIMVVIRHYMGSVSFKEKDRQTIENGMTLHRNITALTGIKVSEDEAIMQRLFFAGSDQLSMDNFQKAEELFKRQYMSFNDGLVLNHEFVTSDLKKRLVKPYCKLAIDRINSGQLNSARKITQEYLKNYGISRLPFVLWLLSYMGKGAMRVMMASYEKWREKYAKLLHQPNT